MMQQVSHTWIWGSSAILPCRSSPVLMVNVGGQPFSGLSRDAQLGLGQGSGWASQEWSQTCSEATPEHSGGGFLPGYLCTWPHSSFLQLQPVVLSLQPHITTLPPPCFTVRTMHWLWQSWPGSIQTCWTTSEPFDQRMCSQHSPGDRTSTRL